MPKIGSYFPFSIWKKNLISVLVIKSDKALVNFNQTRSLTLAQPSLLIYEMLVVDVGCNCCWCYCCVKPNFCYVRLSWVEDELGLWQLKLSYPLRYHVIQVLTIIFQEKPRIWTLPYIQSISASNDNLLIKYGCIPTLIYQIAKKLP